MLSRSPISRYKKLDFNEYYGNELFSVSEEITVIATSAAKNDFDRKVIKQYLRLAVCIRSTFSKARHFYKTIESNRDQLIDVLQRIKETILLKISARLIGISESSIRNWIAQTRVKCSDSLINLCRKVHSNQVLPSETEKMRILLNDPELRFWPLRSIYYHSLKNKLVTMSLSTWYKYALLLKVSRRKPISIKKYGIGVRANMPNQIWHADVSYFRTRDGSLNYIYTVMDNFSIFPLALESHTKLCGKIRVQTFRNALVFALKHCRSITNINLIVDGGAENFNGNVDEFINNISQHGLKPNEFL